MKNSSAVWLSFAITEVITLVIVVLLVAYIQNGKLGIGCEEKDELDQEPVDVRLDSKLAFRLDNWTVVREGSDRELVTFCFDGYRFLAIVSRTSAGKSDFSFVQLHDVDGPTLCFNPFEDGDLDADFFNEEALQESSDNAGER